MSADTAAGTVTDVTPEEKELAGHLTGKVLSEIAEGMTSGEHQVEDAVIAGYLRLAATILNRSQVARS